MTLDAAFANACSILDERLKNSLLSVSSFIQSQTTEICLHNNRVVYMVTTKGILFPDNVGSVFDVPNDDVLVPTHREIENAIMRACGYSVYAHQKEIENGFVAYASGCRLAITGTVCNHGGAVFDWKAVESITLRIARVHKQSGKVFASADDVGSLLIIGEPCSGKTTMLRNIAYSLTDGTLGRFFKVSVIDERNEILPTGIMRTPTVHVLNGIPKSAGIARAVRLCAPEVIICDEIGTMDELNSMKESLSCGVKFICSMHANSFEDVKTKDLYYSLKQHQIFDREILLKGRCNPGQICQMK